MQCNKCGFENADNLKYCGSCGNKLIISEPVVISEPEQTPKSELGSKRDPFAKNYKKIFNICLYPVLSSIVITIFFSFFRSINYFLGTIMDIFLNIWIWLFIAFISVFRRTHKVWALVVSIVLGVITIYASVGLLIFRN